MHDVYDLERAVRDRMSSPVSAEPTPRDRRFLVYLLREFGDVATFTPAFAAGAMMGYMFRAHVDECHPEQVGTALELTLPSIREELREGFRAGYRFEESPRAEP